MGKKGIFRFRIGIGSKRTDNSCNIGGTAGAAEPFLPYRLYMPLSFIPFTAFRNHLQRIHIKEALSVQRHSRQHRIIKCLFHYIPILAVCLCFQHSSGKKGKPDCGTGFRISRIVWQVIGKRKCLSQMCAADSSRHIKLFCYNTVPESFTGCKHGFIPGQPCHIRHAAVKVNRPHSVPHCLRLLLYRKMRLMILKPKFFLFRLLIRSSLKSRPFLFFQIKIIGLLSPLLQKEAGKLQITLFSRQLIQPCQRHFRDFMPGIALTLSLFPPKPGSNKIRIPLRRL